MRGIFTLLFIILHAAPAFAEDAAGGAAASEIKNAVLNFDVAKSVDCILIKDEINFNSEFNPVRVEEGVILPPNPLQITPDQPQVAVSLGASAVKFSILGAGINYSLDGGKFKPLKKVGPDYDIFKLKTEAGQRVALGIPAVINRTKCTNLYVRNAGVMHGKIGTDELCLYDNSLTLSYNMQSSLYTLGKGMVFSPLTPKIATGNSIIELSEVSEDGASIKYREVEPDQTGGLSVQFKGKNLDAHMALESEDGELSFIDQGLERRTKLPVGKYKLAYGFVYAQKEKKVAAIMLPTPKLSNFDVAAGQNTKITLGADISLLFNVHREGKEVVINGWETSLEGKDGERYYCFMVVGKPEVAIRVSARKKKKLYRLGSFCLT